VDFGAWLTEVRQEKGMTQRELAKRCAVTAPYIAHLENGTSEPPPLKTCKVLGRALGMNWEEIWHRSFAHRLRRWLKREGFSGIPDIELLEIAKRIASASR
jgi:DNA-binding XRE family transcriptional regulator